MDKTKVSVKVTVREDIRRFSIVEYSWNLIESTIQKLFPSVELNNYQITYQDDENDWVVISSDEELLEAISMLDKNKPMLRLALKQKVSRKIVRPLIGVNPRIPLGLKSKIKKSCVDEKVKCISTYTKLQRESIRLITSGRKEDLLAARPLLITQMQMKSNHYLPVYNMACNEALLGNTDIAIEYLEKSISLGFSDIKHIENDRDLDSLRQDKRYQEIVNKLKQSKIELLHQKIMRLFEGGTKQSLESAKKLLFLQASINESDPIPQYNLACAEALLGKTKESLYYLEHAISLGYKKLGHILSDEDLVSIRHLPEFQKIISVLQPEKEIPNQEQSDVKQESIIVDPIHKPFEFKLEEAKPSSEVQPNPFVIEHAENLQLLFEMGFINQEENLKVLVKVKGNLEAALSELLN